MFIFISLMTRKSAWDAQKVPVLAGTFPIHMPNVRVWVGMMDGLTFVVPFEKVLNVTKKLDEN